MFSVDRFVSPFSITNTDGEPIRIIVAGGLAEDHPIISQQRFISERLFYKAAKGIGSPSNNIARIIQERAPRIFW